MTKIDKPTFEPLSTSTGEKIRGLVSGLAMIATITAGLCIIVPSFIKNLNFLIARNSIVTFNAWDLPLFAAVPMFIALGYGLCLRIFDKATDVKIQKAMNIILIFGGFFVATRVIYGIAGVYYLSHLGYTSCWNLSSPSLMTPTVYVKAPEYCLDNVGHIRKDLVRWMEQRSTQGQPIDLAEMQIEASRLSEQFDEKFNK